MKVWVKMISVGSLISILAVLAGSALADGNPPALPATSTPADTQPGATEPIVTTPDPADSPAPPTVAPPVSPETNPPVILPVPGTQVQTLLIKQVRPQIVLYMKSAHRWQSLLGQKPLRPINIWALGSPQRATHLLAVWKVRSDQLHRAAKRRMRQSILESRSIVEHWRLVAGIHPVVRTLASSTGNLEEQFAWWRQAQHSVLQQASHPPHAGEFMCIHGGEGSWTANTGNNYYGGLQMDYGFMSTYGAYLLRTKGTANNWTPLEQMWVAARAVPSRGFGPWPNTARACGLL